MQEEKNGWFDPSQLLWFSSKGRWFNAGYTSRSALMVIGLLPVSRPPAQDGW
jgi:hypothetical protein